MTKWAYLEVGVDPATGQVTHVDGKAVSDPQTAPSARQVRSQLGQEGWELVSAQVATWIFKREIIAVQPWEYCCLTEDQAGGLRRGEWVLVFFHADGNHVEHAHRRLGTALAQLGKSGWRLVGVADPGKAEGYDNTRLYFARPLVPRSSAISNGPEQKHQEQQTLS